ncbi:MAG: MFS transporter [Deltaproteobacteria bacterium]|nr:MFS transporter [Deltaproteobacteria bacterium]
MTPLSLLFIISFLVFVDVRILTPVLPSISDSLGSSPGTVGLAMTTYSFAYGLGQLVFGPLSDRTGRIAVVRAASIGFSLFTILSALTTTAWQFIGARLLVGAFAGGPRKGLLSVRLHAVFGDRDRQCLIWKAGGRGALRNNLRHRRYRPDHHRPCDNPLSAAQRERIGDFLIVRHGKASWAMRRLDPEAGLIMLSWE